MMQESVVLHSFTCFLWNLGPIRQDQSWYMAHTWVPLECFPCCLSPLTKTHTHTHTHTNSPTSLLLFLFLSFSISLSLSLPPTSPIPIEHSNALLFRVSVCCL